MPQRALEVVEGRRIKFAMSGLLSFECIGQECRDSPGKRTKRREVLVVMRLQVTGMRQLRRQELCGGVSQGRGRSKAVAGIDAQDSMPLRNRKGRDDDE